MHAPLVTHSPPLPCTPLHRPTRPPPHVNRITDRCKNINFPQLLLWTVISYTALKWLRGAKILQLTPVEILTIAFQGNIALVLRGPSFCFKVGLRLLLFTVIDTGNLSYWWGARDMYDTEPEIWYRILRCANRHRNANASDFYGTKYRGLEVQV